MNKTQTQSNVVNKGCNIDLQMKDVLTMKEAQAYTGFSRAYLYKLTHEKKIPYYKPNGKCVFFNRGELEKWLLRNRVATDYEIQEKVHLLMKDLRS